MNFKELNELINNDESKPARTWLLSFIDLLSLMLAFFVLVYSTKDVPKDKIVKIGDSFVEYIHGKKPDAIYIPNIKTHENENIIKTPESLNYLNTLLKKSLLENQDLHISMIEEKNQTIIQFEESTDLTQQISDQINDRLILISKTLSPLSNQIEVDVENTDIDSTLKYSNYISNKLVEFGYEHKILRSLPNENLITENLEKNKNKLKIQIIVKAYETIF